MGFSIKILPESSPQIIAHGLQQTSMKKQLDYFLSSNEFKVKLVGHPHDDSNWHGNKLHARKHMYYPTVK